MKKTLTLITLLVLVTSIGSAQDIWGQGKMRAGAGGYFLLPTGTWGDLYGVGFGGFGKFEYGLNEDMVLQGSLGYILWSEKTTGNVKTSATALPIDVAFKYNLSKIVTPGFYAMASLGLWSITQKQEIPPTTVFGVTFGGTSDVSSSNDVLALGVGYDTGMLDINARYTLNGNFNNILVGVAYNFAL